MSIKITLNTNKMFKYTVKKDFAVGEVEYKEGTVVEFEEADAAPFVADGSLELVVEQLSS